MIYWMEGLRINWEWFGTVVRMNLGRTGYLYWEKGSQHGVIQLWR